MTATAIPLPTCFQPQAVSFFRGGAEWTGPIVGERPVQIVRGDSGYWRAAYDSMMLRKAAVDEVLAYRAIEAIDALEKPVWLVPVQDCRHSPRAASGLPYATKTSYSDGATFSDGAHFSQWVLDFAISEAASAWATTVRLQQLGDALIQAGHYFSVFSDEGFRLYRVARSYLIGASTWECEIWPPLRAAISTSDKIDAERPVCPMLLDGDLGLVLRQGIHGFKSLQFVEARW